MNYKFADLDKWVAEVQRRAVDVVTVCGVEVERSVKFGSELTGAPGQPVDSSNLRDSYIPERLGPLEWQITTNTEYAEPIEDGIQQPYVNANGTVVTPRAIVFKSAVGGAHSIALTRAGWPRIAEHATEQVVGRRP